ncbi:hypothetical protein ACFFWC_11960 [Plantactinospora siamensis]|uniref:Pentapeptide repeat-containing protein n=1 Tax=Plantactinospora siamensis TaxID=555372 RepID=A0ABV6P3L8_9ACTN
MDTATSAEHPAWWRGRTPDLAPVWGPHTVVLSGRVSDVDLTAAPLDESQLRAVRFDRAEVTGVDLSLDELALTTMWSSFDGCVFRQRGRRLHRDGYEPQGSFGNRPCIYRSCTFVGVRLRIRAGFHVGEARFEDCTFERCRFEEFFSFSADFVGCRFVGPIKMAAIYGTDPHTGRRNEIHGNNFRAAGLSDNIGLRADFPVESQLWPEGFPVGHPPRA